MDKKRAFKLKDEFKSDGYAFCPFRETTAVWCTTPGECKNCGWHPLVEDRRKEKIREKMSLNVQ